MTAPSSPNLFLVGVQRSATTALSRYLRQHPDVFMATKELHYFGADLGGPGQPDGSAHRLTLAEYLGYFEAAEEERYRGDASVGYIYSKTAAEEIAEFCPEARIIASFRNPVDVLYSSYSLFRFQGIEPAESFTEALADSEHRRWAYTATAFRWGFTYPTLVHYAEALERYLSVFGRERVHVLIYEDFVADAGGEYRKVLEFLGVDPTFEPTMEAVFANRELRSPVLQRVIGSPPSALRHLARRVVPSQVARRKLGRALTARNVRVAPREELGPDLRRELDDAFLPEVERFSRLVGRDLRALWSGASPATKSS